MSKIIRECRKIFTSFSPVLANKIMYFHKMKKNLNLKNPQTFNEKINWLKLYNYPYNQKVINCTDKYKVRDYVQEKGYGSYLNELYFSFNDIEEIDWDQLPNKFVLKCNHGAGYNILCKNKKMLDIEISKNKLKKWLKEDFGKVSAELHYSKIKRKIICEKYLDDDIIDYKFFCFKGQPKFFYVSQAPEGDYHNMKASFFYLNGEKADFKRTDHDELSENIILPKELNEMIEIARDLSSDFNFVRVDLFNVKGKIYFSELTFSPCSGFMPFSPEAYDFKYGEYINIDN